MSEPDAVGKRLSELFGPGYGSQSVNELLDKTSKVLDSTEVKIFDLSAGRTYIPIRACSPNTGCSATWP